MPPWYNETSNHGIGAGMNAEDLVITLKKNMAKLSKSERRRAIESVRDIIRAAMFDVLPPYMDYWVSRAV